MSQLGTLEAGSRHDLHVGISPDAPDESELRDEADGAFGYAHSYETSSRYDGPGLRVVLFVSGCLLRCSYCHNPDTWHLKDGTYVSAQQVHRSARRFRLGATIARRRPDHLRRRTDGAARLHAANPGGAKQMGLHTAIETSGFLGDRCDDDYLSRLDLVLLDIKSSDPETYRAVTGRDLAPTLRFAERLAAMGKPVWVRFTLVPGFTDDPANVDGIARFVAPMKNVEWVEVQPFHQLGAFKWKAMKLDYKNVNTPTPTRDLVNRVIEQFRAAGCRAR